jgi:hypothetical protein
MPHPTPDRLDQAVSGDDQAGPRSLDLVQRLVASALTVVVLGSLVAGLTAFVVISADQIARGRVIGLWVMVGVVGLVTAAAVLVINRRRPYSPWVALGLLPMAVVWFVIFT